MASLQIRNLPPDLYEALSYRAEREGRSLAQQAVAELRRIPDLETGHERRRVLQELRETHRDRSLRLSISPEELIREDRDR